MFAICDLVESEVVGNAKSILLRCVASAQQIINSGHISESGNL